MTVLPTAERGLKHTCISCSTRFYDFMKKPAACPKCRHLVPIMRPRVKRGRRKAADIAAEGLAAKAG